MIKHIPLHNRPCIAYLTLYFETCQQTFFNHLIDVCNADFVWLHFLDQWHPTSPPQQWQKDTLATVLHNPKNRVNDENILNKMSTT